MAGGWRAWRTWKDIENELGEALRRPGRPRIRDAELRRVAEVVKDAQRNRQPTAAAVAKAFELTPDAAKKRIRKARDRGFLPPTEPRRARAERAGEGGHQ